MAFLSELLTYTFKYIVLGAIAVAGVVCCVKQKKKQLLEAAEQEKETEKETE